MKKAERQQKIREIITNESIERQEDLVARLREMGLTVTQATISRDIKEMQLIKIPADNGGYRYGLPTYHHQGHENQLAQTLQDSLEQLKRNDCFLALTVHPGNGPVVATLIRKMDFPTVFTTIGDDGNVLVVCMSPEAAIKLEEKLNAMLD
ncbi:ArgR family transcriptional regulator [Limosilactobacillus reuteri]|uniref:arginine repressor n=1 Tax=Limosilactobacillus reuteri TaxID=1598 RepID=UPI001E50DC6C|nr:ArgR family transcriptional regulator [Limosilactobacillus reuteri]MCC4327280.1 ArgR family transcriptional regulator [Limosilactobacillus reuteri]MCC4336301.1 ArgR family transcriptional regulator [Limosilactobacillus reuteri]MCC4338848.1 ArgR family transcriptional regulator [Limosilactobacillus reuteri]MCC4347712.1 ArgR family transcriptional regulator [Limosilactobacillus reuteri]MCC4376198.1 ArgR family transcriptional regulator [Limosilactobacillus reuteri]